MHWIDFVIIVAYLALMIAVGSLVAKRAARSSESYFLAGKSLPWWLIGIAHGSSGVDITGTMWFVMMLLVYGVKAVWLLWVWPLFNVLFRMVYLGAWVRRSNVLTGAEWMRTRFGYGVGAELGYLSVVVYALVSVVGFLSYAFRGIGDFVVPYLPWGETFHLALPGMEQAVAVSAANVYATVILLITGTYCVLGGMYSVVLNDVIQFSLICVAAVVVAVVAIAHTAPEQILAAVPPGWDELFFGWKLDYDWSVRGLSALDWKLYAPVGQGGDGYALFGFFVGMLFLKGVFVSMAGPTPNYAIQHVLSTRNPREAALENMVMSIASLLPRFLFVGGITVIAIGFFLPSLKDATRGADAPRDSSSVVSATAPATPGDVAAPSGSAASVSAPGAASGASLAAAASQADAALQKARLKAAQRKIEAVLPAVIQEGDYVPVGLKGLILAALLAAFMSTFVSTVNSGAAYVVNDVYKRYVDPAAPQKRLVALSYAASTGVILLGIVFGFATQRVHGVTEWIVSALVPAFVAPNVLKWHWWRFNGFGFFAGMLAGLVAALAIPSLGSGLHPITLFMSVLGISTAASLAVCLLTRPDDEQVLKSFYRTVRPWGFWNPILEKLQAEDPSVEKNRGLPRDVLNLAVALVWQTSMVALPIYLVIQQWGRTALCVGIFAAASVVLKFTWYDHLDPPPDAA